MSSGADVSSTTLTMPKSVYNSTMNRIEARQGVDSESRAQSQTNFSSKEITSQKQDLSTLAEETVDMKDERMQY